MGGGGRRPVAPAHLEDGDGDGEEGRRRGRRPEERACPAEEERPRSVEAASCSRAPARGHVPAAAAFALPPRA